ncbi:MAG: VCBS repeat-containing protein [Myxococcota bacterium]
MPVATARNVEENAPLREQTHFRALRTSLALGIFAIAGCGDERSLELSLRVPALERSDVCVTAFSEGELVFAQSYPATAATGTLTFVAGDRIDRSLHITASLRRGGRSFAREAGRAVFRAPGESQLELEPTRCVMLSSAPPETLGTVAADAALFAVDLDGDGNEEVLASSASIAIVGAGEIDDSLGATPVAAADIDGDCRPELIVTTSAGTVAFPSRAPLGSATLLAAVGDAGRGQELALADEAGLRWGALGGEARTLTGDIVRTLVVADFNGDDLDDLAAASEEGVNVFFGGAGGPAAVLGATPSDWRGHHLAVGDFDGDGAPDLALADDAEVRVARNRGDGFFEARASLPIVATELRVVDANRDCRADLVILGDRPQIYLGGDDLAFQGGPLLENVADAVAADIDGDGASELILRSPTGEVRTWAP